PETGRLHPSAANLLEHSELIGDTRYRRLCAADMVLHSAAHMFQSGDLHQSLRELADLDGLLRFFSEQPDFWTELVQRVPEMALQRPLFYALRYSRRFLQTPIPDSVIALSNAWRPPSQVLSVMDQLVSRALVPEHAKTTAFA